MLRGILNFSSFFQRQLLGMVGVNLLSLAIMSGLFFQSFVGNYEDSVIEAMQGKAMLLAATNTSALLFQDEQSATQSLASLEQHASARYGQIFDSDMNVFAEYVSPGQQVDFMPRDFNESVVFANGNFYVALPITLDNEQLGVIVVSESGGGMLEQRQRYLQMAIAIFFGSILLAYILNWKLQQLFTEPVSRLVDFVAHVARYKRYHQRLEVLRDDEIGGIVSGVNALLDTIERHEAELHSRANYDELTGLPNRHLLADRLSHAIDSASRRNTSMALLFLDLDRFKIINDSLGHNLGDAVLVAVSGILSGLLRQSDSVSRWGGDEFVILLEDIDREESAERLSEKIQAELQKPILVEGHLLHVSTSIGVARFPQHGLDAETLLRHADMSMYHAKGQAPGKIAYFNTDMEVFSAQRLSLESKVRRALEEEEFSLAYQPQISLRTGELVGFEVLARWVLDGEHIAPIRFLPVIAEAGLMDEFTRWVMGKACLQNAQWQAMGLMQVKVAVNLPATFFNRAQALEDILSSLQCAGLDAQWLELEITEDTFVSANSGAVAALATLQGKGVTIAVDDFGTGYSCLSYLQTLPVGVLKIDGCFVDSISSQASRGIVQSITTLGKSLNMLVVAECVENEQQVAALREIGCDIAQGYLYSKPLCAEKAGEYLLSQTSQHPASFDNAHNGAVSGYL